MYNLVGVGGNSTISTLQEGVLGKLVNGTTINKLLQAEAFSGNEAYKAQDMLNDLQAGIWSELASKKPIDIYRRNLQKIYTEKLVDLIKPSSQPFITIGSSAVFQSGSLSKTNDGLSIIKGQARMLLREVKQAIPVTTDTATKLHLQDVSDRLTKVLKVDEN